MRPFNYNLITQITHSISTLSLGSNRLLQLIISKVPLLIGPMMDSMLGKLMYLDSIQLVLQLQRVLNTEVVFYHHLETNEVNDDYL